MEKNAESSASQQRQRPVVPSQRKFLEDNLKTLLPLVRKLRSVSHAYSRGFIWEPTEGDWVLHVDPSTGEENVRMVWAIVQDGEGNGHPERPLLVFEISFPDDRFDEVVEVGEITDCLFLPTERQCWEWIHERECCIELSRVGDATELRPVIAVPRVKRIHPSPLHALYSVVCAILEHPRMI